ncbi:MAG: ADYC domain-containing protein [Nannocystaceae bacterium]
MNARTRIQAIAIGIGLGLTGGCYAGPSGVDDVDEGIIYRTNENNSLHLNSAIFNYDFGYGGGRINGVSLSDAYFNGYQYGGGRINGIELTGVSITDGAFEGVLANNDVVAAADFIGAELDLVLDAVVDGENVQGQATVRIDDVYQSPIDSRVLYHLISYRDADNNWQPVCSDAEGNPLEAIVMDRVWDLNTGSQLEEEGFTIACRDAAIGKCVDWGYVPWETTLDCLFDPPKFLPKKVKKLFEQKYCKTIDLRDHHQACTRMVRNDMCGDGKPYTVNGTLIDVGDALHPHIDKFETKWPYEAEWNPDGAYCITDSLRLSLVNGDPDFEEPACFQELSAKKVWKCGKLKHDRALMATRFSMEEQVIAPEDIDLDEED